MNVSTRDDFRTSSPLSRTFCTLAGVGSEIVSRHAFSVTRKDRSLQFRGSNMKILIAIAVMCTFGIAQTVSNDPKPKKKELHQEKKHSSAKKPRRNVRKTWLDDDLFDDEENGRRRSGWFPIPFLGLPLSDVVAEGSKGIDDSFKDMAVPAPIRDLSNADLPPNTTVHRVAPIVAPIRETAMPPTEVSVVEPWEIVSTEGRVSESNGSVCHYTWRVLVKNTTDHDMTLSGTVAFLNREGWSVDASEVNGLRLDRHSQQEFGGSKMMTVDVAQSVVKSNVRFTEQ